MDSLFHFDLPEELIAQEPANPRDQARLLVFDRKTKSITDDNFFNLSKYLHPQTALVVNNTKVANCRYLFNEGKMEIFVVEVLNDKTVRALVRPGRKFRVGSSLELASGLSAQVKAIGDDGLRTILFDQPLDSKILVEASHVPLPPYIKQNDDLEEEYQTIYAKKSGSKASPTAGLHFTEDLKSKIEQNHEWLEITLEVGLGTFAPLKPENFSTKTLHAEKYCIDPDVYHKITSAKHVTAVGTTSLRTLETVFAGPSPSLSGETSIFITPGHDFKRVNSLITNFHLPSTSLLLLVEAFLGSRQDIERIYEHAISNRYRFYSFGDGMLIL